MKSCCITDTR